MLGKIIVIDGPDGTGKNTTTNRVVDLLRTRRPLGDREIFTESFPDYSAYFGKQVRNYLNGDDANELVRVPEEIRADPLLASMPYAEDRYWTYIKRMKANLEKGGVYILDRYVQSNMAHQGAKVPDIKDRDVFCAKIVLLEHSIFGLPHADHTIILNLEESLRDARVKSRRQELAGQTWQVGITDIHEQNDAYMAEVAWEYLRLAKDNDWAIVNCNHDRYELTPEEVAEEVYASIVTKSKEASWLI